MPPMTAFMRALAASLAFGFGDGVNFEEVV